jgi:outer membrane protein OmpA-like peptidoglycan-associated protein
MSQRVKSEKTETPERAASSSREAAVPVLEPPAPDEELLAGLLDGFSRDMQVDLLNGLRSGEQRARLLTGLQRTRGNAYVQRLVAPRAIQRVGESTPTREPGEAAASQTSPFRLITLRPGTHPTLRVWLLFDFAVGSAEFLPAKVSDLNTLLAPLLSRVRNPFLLGGSMVRRYLNVLGYSDSPGADTLNASLRQGRADQFYRSFPQPEKIISWSGASLSEYIADNAARAGRGRNRSVTIEEVMRVEDVPPPTREETERERRRAETDLPTYITRSIPLIRANADLSAEQKTRIIGFLQMIQRTGVNDEYLTASTAQLYYRRNMFRESPSALAGSLRREVIDAIRYSGGDINRFVTRMISLDTAIYSGIHMITRYYNVYGDESAAARNLGTWLRERQDNPNSIYSIYRD